MKGFDEAANSDKKKATLGLQNMFFFVVYLYLCVCYSICAFFKFYVDVEFILFLYISLKRASPNRLPRGTNRLHMHISGRQSPQRRLRRHIVLILFRKL